MHIDIILAGVGGQGILTTAKAISLVALRRGWHVKQSEVHGMSQRGGAVQSHLRLSDRSIHSDLIPRRSADLILALEPLEALRYQNFLAESGIIVSNVAPLANIPNYGDTNLILDRISQRPQHVLVDAHRLAALAGSSRSINMVMFGAASDVLDLAADECRDAIGEMLATKGRDLVEVNCRAFELGRQAAFLYCNALADGLNPRSVRDWMSKLSLAELERAAVRNAAAREPVASLTPEANRVIAAILQKAESDGRRQLLEPEVYSIIEAAGAIRPPCHVMVSDSAQVTDAMLSRFGTDRLVLKAVSPRIVHKSDADAVVCVPKSLELVRRHVDLLLSRLRAIADRVDGVLLVEFVEHESAGFGGELFVGVRVTREFGPVLAAGLGGVDTEYLAAKLRPGLSVAKVPVMDVSAEAFFAQFQKTVAYEILSGATRGHRRLVSDGELRRCFRAFQSIARQFCLARGQDGPELIELEVNPFAFRRQALVPLDGRGRLGKNPRALCARSPEQVDRLVAPRSIAIAGVSSTRQNFGRIILNNTRTCGFPADALTVIKPNESSIDGIRCVPDLRALSSPVDLLILATGVADIPPAVDDVLATGCARATIIITGGLGELAGTERIHETLQDRIEQYRRTTADGPVFLGENCMGVRSRPGRFDTFFIQDKKLDPRRSASPRPLALVSQSGAFVISRLSNVPQLDPVLTISLGNQLDVTLSDAVSAVGRRSEVDVIGVYAEGFREWDGLEFARAVQRLSAAGKLVVFYKAGRTEQGRSATAGHTASVAGDYDVCLSAVEQAGGLVVESVRDFEQMLQVAVAFHGLPFRGARIGALTNAGCEAVAMADSISGPRHALELARWSPQTTHRISEIVARHRLNSLVNVANPLDITPMAGDAAFEELSTVMLDDAEVDAVVVAVVPLTPQMRTSPDEINDDASLCIRMPALAARYDKPLLMVVDAGEVYDPYVRRLESSGLVVLRESDEAVRCLGRYLCHRLSNTAGAPSDARRNAEHPVGGAGRPIVGNLLSAAPLGS